MANQLHFELKKLPNPYTEQHPDELWGELLIRVETEDNQDITLLQTQWNLETLVEWVAQNEDSLSYDKLVIEGHEPLPGESLAKALDRLQNWEFAEDEDEAMFRWYEALAEYGSRHRLRAALPGANIPDIIIGYNQGKGEISFLGDNDNTNYPQMPEFYANLGEWSYLFDMQKFMISFDDNLSDFLRVKVKFHQFKNGSLVQGITLEREKYKVERLGWK
jgi:hypothetical protein